MEQVCFEAVLDEKQMQKVASLAEDIWYEHYGRLLGEKQIAYMLEKFQSVSAIEEQQRHGYQYYLITYDGDAHGYIGLQPQGNTLFLSKLYLQKQARGKGIARQALDMTREICREKGLSSIYLTVNKHNSSKQVYEALGFKTTREEVTDIGNGFVMDDYIMEILIGE